MSNDVIYPSYKEALLSGEPNISLTSGTVKVTLVDTNSTTFSIADEFYSDLNPTGLIADAELDVISVDDGVLVANDVVIETTTDVECEAVVLWIDTGSATSSRLVAWLEDSMTGIPIRTLSANVEIDWNDLGIFKL